MKKRCLWIMLALAVSMTTLIYADKPAIASHSPQVYLIDIQGVGTWWNLWNSTEIAKAAKSLFESKGFQVEIIKDFISLDYIVNNPPEDVIVINAHGEILPMSTSWTDWNTYATTLGNNVKNLGWIFVSVLGYPMFYYDQGSGMICIGSGGVNTFLSVVPGLSVGCKIVNAGEPAYPSNLTDAGKEAALYMGTSLPINAITIRPHMWSVNPDYVFYLQIDDPWAAEGFKYGASAVSMGNGFFILNGFGDGRLEPEVPLATNETVGEAAAAFSAYILSQKLPPPLSVSISPLSASIIVGESVTFTSATTGGYPPYTYQWYLNGTAVSGATSPSWTFTPTTSGYYIVRLKVTDSLSNTANSNEATVTVAPPLTVSISPTSASILVGQPITFTSTVSGGYTPYSYQWYLNGNPVSGATSNTWTFTPTTSGIYYVNLKVTDNKGNTAQSDTARITVASVPVGGYSISIEVPTTASPLKPYLALVVILTVGFVAIERKIVKKTK